MGKGNDTPVDPRPVSTLRDPASFGPPPKRIPNAGISNNGQASGPSSEGVRGNNEEAKRPVPQKLYTANTTGLNTETLPLPSRRADMFAESGDEADTSRKRPPPIPPRLPPRGESALPVPRDVVDMSTGGVSVAAVGRLSKAGISIPGFNMTPTTPPANPKPPASISYLGSHPANPQGTPKEGTTFAEKKAAVATANSFYKNPASVSFSDATAALKTGRNFQQRHGDQVASGYKKAQDMGLDKKIQGYGELYASRNDTGRVVVPRNPLPTQPLALSTKKLPIPDLPTRLPIVSIVSAIAPSPPGHGRKKPPPPLPKKKPVLPPPRTQSAITPSSSSSSSHNSPRPPPVIPSGTRPSPLAVLRNNGLPSQIFPESPPELDLCLSEAWFSKTPPGLPLSIECIEEKMHSFTSSWERLPSGRTKHTLVLSIRWTLNLSTTKIKITWDASAPSATAKAEQKHFPPPSYPPQKKEWGERIVDWTRARMGQQVGNGECWTLAADCFSSLRAEDEAISTEKIMTAQGTSFGLCIFSHYPSVQHQPTILSGFALKPGDILQFRSARWIRRDSSGRVVSEMRAGGPEDAAGCKDHTAIVETVQYNQVGIKLGVLQQNSNGLRSITSGEYVLGTDEMIEGGVRVFRAVADDWAEFKAGW